MSGPRLGHPDRGDAEVPVRHDGRQQIAWTGLRPAGPVGRDRVRCEPVAGRGLGERRVVNLLDHTGGDQDIPMYAPLFPEVTISGEDCLNLNYLDDLAYTVLRVTESFHYLPTITGEPADPERATLVLKAILR
jgi:hypothetical protein